MTAERIDGKQIAQNLKDDLKTQVTKLKTDHNIQPSLAVVLVGEDPASQVYVASKAKQCVEIGMESLEYKLAADSSEAEVLELVAKLNDDENVNGILVQFPVPDHISQQKIIELIDPDKDVDGLHPMNAGRLASGIDGLVSCTPLGCLKIAEQTLGDLSGKHAVIIGRSNLVGKPVAQLLLNANCTVTICHSRSKNIEEICREGDILVAAVGRPEMVKKDWVKPGACVIDVGINRVMVDGKAKLRGDVDYNDVADVAKQITPVPGGVGPMTIACLLHNNFHATLKQHDLK